MNNVLLHTCCAPCSLSCIAPLRAEGIEPVAFWYNPNIHPWKEYQARRDCLLEYAPTIGMEVRVREDYGYPPLVTPSSQIVGTQAVMNVILGERYKTFTKESKAMLRGAQLFRLYHHAAGQSLSGPRGHHPGGRAVRQAIWRGVPLPGFPSQLPGRKPAGPGKGLLYAEVLRVRVLRAGSLPKADQPGPGALPGGFLSLYII